MKRGFAQMWAGGMSVHAHSLVVSGVKLYVVYVRTTRVAVIYQGWKRSGEKVNGGAMGTHDARRE